MIRRSTPYSKTDDTTFACRMRIVVPELGFGNTLTEMHFWLRNRLDGEWAMWGACSGERSLTFIYANDPLALADLVREFGLTVHAIPKRTP